MNRSPIGVADCDGQERTTPLFVGVMARLNVRCEKAAGTLQQKTIRQSARKYVGRILFMAAGLRGRIGCCLLRRPGRVPTWECLLRRAGLRLKQSSSNQSDCFRIATDR